MSSDKSRGEELIFALQHHVEQLESKVRRLEGRQSELAYINQEHKHLNGTLREELRTVTRQFKELQAKVNIKVMNGQWHMSNDIDADDLEIKEKTDE